MSSLRSREQCPGHSCRLQAPEIGTIFARLRPGSARPGCQPGDCQQPRGLSRVRRTTQYLSVPSLLLPLLLLLLAIATPASADWRYAPPPAGAIVTYSDGRVSRIDSAAGEAIALVEILNGVVEETDYRTWLLRVRLERQDRPGEIVMVTAAETAILALWPLQAGETLAYSYQARQGDQMAVNGQVVLSYAGEETLQLEAGTLRAHRLVRDYVYTETASGKEFRGTQTTWHEAATGLILQVTWESEGPRGKDSGIYQATKIELP